MSIFDDIRAKGAAYRLTEESLYAEALREVESGQLRDGIWAKALAESDMDQGKAGARYIKLRVQSLKDEVTLFIAGLKQVSTENRQKHLAKSKVHPIASGSVLDLFPSLPRSAHKLPAPGRVTGLFCIFVGLVGLLAAIGDFFMGGVGISIPMIVSILIALVFLPAGFYYVAFFRKRS